MDNILTFEIPKFHPKYKRSEKYGYKNTKEKDNLKAVLEESSRGYCMYCYSRMRVDGKLYANLEHAIEKKNSEKLIECIPNIGIACPVCNQVFKRKGEKKRILSSNTIQEYESKSRCTLLKRKQCTVPCFALKALQKQYNILDEGKIILQPMGIVGNDSKENLAIQYDVMNMEFQPADSFHTYSDEEREIISTHIKRFKLNDPKYRTRQLYDFIKNIIDNNGKIPRYEYNNFIIELFAECLKNKTSGEILKICESIFSIIFLKV